MRPKSIHIHFLTSNSRGHGEDTPDLAERRLYVLQAGVSSDASGVVFGQLENEILPMLYAHWPEKSRKTIISMLSRVPSAAVAVEACKALGVAPVFHGPAAFQGLQFGDIMGDDAEEDSDHDEPLEWRAPQTPINTSSLTPRSTPTDGPWSGGFDSEGRPRSYQDMVATEQEVALGLRSGGVDASGSPL